MSHVRTPGELPKQIRRLLVANRGEIAVRIVRACQALNIECVLAVSEADVDTLGARLANATVVIGPGPAAQSYLRIDAIVDAALRSGCDAVHPGYGFLSERSGFARACREANLLFVGPSPEAIDAMGDKITAVGLAEKAGVPRVPGSGALRDYIHAKQCASNLGYPVLIKATAGGGGRGMRIVHVENDLEGAMSSAANEAQSAFGDATLYMEKFVESARHIEIQIMADSHGNVVHLGERECSTQRRHQKLIEEAPSPSITAAMRDAMGECAVRLASNAGYLNAGTVEFVVDLTAQSFYFLEMNTRIQVEHPVTELVTGIDIVVEQIRVAQGEKLSFTQSDVQMHGHAIECRINAENPDKNFLPRPGKLDLWWLPQGEGVRVDTHCYEGYEVPPFYDSLLAKLIVHGSTRGEAIERMKNALTDFRIGGLPTTKVLHEDVLRHDDFVQANVTTRWVENTLLPQRKAKMNAAKEKNRTANQEV
jgi:acetyl-CoA carboxylase biotin carboxylase subunit